MNFFFRLDCRDKVGMGHLSRSIKMANVFKKNGHNCFFYIDNIKDLKKIKIDYPVHQMGKNYKYKSQYTDAKIFLKIIKQNKAFIVLDDYRSKDIWKKTVKRSRHKLVCINDNIELDKFSDYVINFKISSYKVKKLKNYKSKKTKYLLGPKYALLENEKNNINHYKYSKFNIVIYLGGSGDLNIFNGISKKIKETFSQNRVKNFEIKIILGPLAKNQKLFVSKFRSDKKINIITNEYNLTNVYKKCQLFIGSSGNSIYETCFANIPTILFKYAKNQNDSIYDLEMMGHYISLDKKDIFRFNKIAYLANLIFKNYSRIKKITNTKKIKIDTNGPKRIYDIILKRKKIINYDSFYEKSKTAKNTFSKAKDTDINNILALRNEKQNRINSLNTEKKSNLDHYIWWFESKKNLYLIKKNNLLNMFFWNKSIKLENTKRYMLTGWASRKNLNFVDILSGVKKFNNTLNKNIKLLSIVKKSNKVSLSIDRYLGYKKIAKLEIPITNFLKKTKIKIKDFVISVK